MLQGTISPHSMPSVQGSSECSGYEPPRLERPMRQLQAVIMPWKHCGIWQQAATDALRAGVLLHEYGDQCTNYFHHLHRQRHQVKSITHLPQQHEFPVADLCTMPGRQQADSILINFFSADSPQACSGSCLLTCQHSNRCCRQWTAIRYPTSMRGCRGGHHAR